MSNVQRKDKPPAASDAPNENETLVVHYIEQEYKVDGRIPLIDEIADKMNLPRPIVMDALDSPRTHGALQRRGIYISEDKFNKIWQTETDTVLTPLQLEVINAMLDYRDGRSEKKKLADYEVSSAQYAAWLKSPKIKRYIARRMEDFLTDAAPEADMALIDGVRSGELAAIKYFNEMTGRFVSGSGGVDARWLLGRILEIIHRNVSDPVQLQKIGLEIEQLG